MLNKRALFGMSKAFVIVLALATLLAFATHNFYNFIVLMGIYIVVKIIWNILT